MSERTKHLFQFSAKTIAGAATAQAEYHEKRRAYWREEFEKSVSIVKRTAKVEIKEFEVTGGKRAEVVVDYGDPAAYRRMQEASGKIDSHCKAADTFRTDANVYSSQPASRAYELDAADVLYYRLGGGPQED